MRATDLAIIAAGSMLALAGLAVVCQPQEGQRSPAPRERVYLDDSRFLVVKYLPAGYVEDGSVDYSVELREAAAAAAGGVLVLPDFPLRVSPAPGERWCLRLDAPIAVEGTPGSELFTYASAAQVIRAEAVDGVVLRDFAVTGPGDDGAGLGNGLVQITGGSRVRIEGLTVTDADADGIAVASCVDVAVERCVVRGASKAAIYVNESRRVRVAHNSVASFGGHAAPSGETIGAGIQLSSCELLVCEGNVVDGGLGVGILCNALQDGAAPRDNLIVENVVVGATNVENPTTSSGIRLANSAPNKVTRTVVRGNVVRACGAHGVYVEHHDGVTVEGNQVSETARAGIVIGAIQGALVARNALSDVGTDGVEGLDAISLINGASGVVVRENQLTRDRTEMSATAHARVGDKSGGLGNEIHPRQLVALGPPVSGQWFLGDLVLDASPAGSGPIGWVCYQTGVPGLWRPLDP